MIDSVKYEQNLRRLRQAEEARRFIPFYRNDLRPLLDKGVLDLLAGDKSLTHEQLIALQQYAKAIRDIEIVMVRVINTGVPITQAIRDQLLKGAK